MLYYEDTKLRSRRRLRKGLYTRAKSPSEPLTRLHVDVAGAVPQRRHITPPFQKKPALRLCKPLVKRERKRKKKI